MATTSTTAELACEVCGRLPHPRKARLTAATVLAMVPVELAVHAIVLASDLSYLAKVLVLTLAATVTVIWIAEPSIMRLLRRWLHGPALSERSGYAAADNLYRIRTRVHDVPGALQSLTQGLALMDANILGMHIHTVADGAVDEFVVGTPLDVTSRDLIEVVEDAGGMDVQVWRTTALSLVDSQTRALDLAVEVASNPAHLPHVVAELLRADAVPTTTPGAPTSHLSAGATLVKVPSRWTGAYVFSRPGEPFTPAESARAHRLAELAETVEAQRTAVPPEARAQLRAPRE